MFEQKNKNYLKNKKKIVVSQIFQIVQSNMNWDLIESRKLLDLYFKSGPF